MLMDRCLPSCFVFLRSVIMLFMLVLLYYGPCLVVVHVGDGLRCMTIVCPEYRCYACSFAPSWLNACMVVYRYVIAWYLLLMLVVMYAMSSVVLDIFMLIFMVCSVGYDSLLIWWIVMLHPHAYAYIMLMHCNCIMLFYHGSAYCIQV